VTTDCPPKLAGVIAEAYEGGGTLGLAYVPVVEALERWRVPIVHHAGTSAGAITALLRALCLPAARVRELQETTPWARFARYRPPALLRLLVTGGWHPIDYARGWIRDRVAEAGFHPDLSFLGLRHRTGRSLSVVVTRYFSRGNGPDAEPWVLSPDSTPELSVADGVLASMAVPLFWPPVRVDGWWCCDGGVAVNHPLSVYSLLPPAQVLGVRLDSALELGAGDLAREPFRPGVASVVPALAGMLRSISCRAHIPAELWPRVVRIDVGAERALDFSAGADRIARLRSAGDAALRSWLAAPC
jgi:predicted acylesterase/phospholipase RssA